jgi:hypothetical protein
MTPEEVAELKRLATEFRNELTSLGANVRDINNRLDALAKDVADIKGQLDRMPKFGGDFFVGVRTDRSPMRTVIVPARFARPIAASLARRTWFMTSTSV